MATKTQAVTPRRSRWGLSIGAAVAAAGIVVFGWALWRRSLVIAGLPAPVSTANRELSRRLAEADSEARSLSHPVRGLAALSRLYHANGDYEQALQCYTVLRRLEPKAPQWPHLEANLLALYGRMDDAIPREAKAVELAPDYIPARLRLADEYQKSGRWREARNAFNDVLARSKDNPYALLGVALCDVQEGNWNAASDSLRRAIDANPEFIGAMSLMVTVYDHFGDSFDAEALRQTIGRREFIDLEDPWLDELMSDCYDAYRLSVTAAVQNFAGHPVVAEALLRRSIELDPQASSYHRQLGNLLSKAGNTPEARSQFETAVHCDPSDNDAWLLLYQVEQTMQDSAAATTTLAQALQHCPDSASLHLEKAHLMRALGRNDEQEAELRETYRCDMRDPQPLDELALLHLSENRIGDAIAELKEALVRRPGNPQATAMMTFCLIKAGNEAEATRWWVERVASQPRMPASLKDPLQQAFQSRFGHPLP